MIRTRHNSGNKDHQSFCTAFFLVSVLKLHRPLSQSIELCLAPPGDSPLIISPVRSAISLSSSQNNFSSILGSPPLHPHYKGVS